MKQLRSIIYVNYSPYENSGKVLDFLLENFEYVFLFSLGFYNLKNKKKYNVLLTYTEGKVLEEHFLFSFNIPASSKITHLLIPIRSSINFFQIVWHSFWLARRFGKIDMYFTVNAFPAWIGNLLKGMGIIKKTVFWVWDYYPPIHENKIIMLMRHIYWQFDKISSHSDRVVFVNRRLLDLRKDMGIFPKNAEYPIVPIGTDKFTYVKKRNFQTITFGFIGVLKKSQGLGIVFDNAQKLKKELSKIRYEIVGSGPDEEYFKSRARASGIDARFHGYLEGESFNDILRKCTIGVATYIPDSSNVAHYGDQGKIKRYLSLGIPVIATGVSEFSKEVEKSGAGVIIDYNNPRAFVGAVKKIMTRYPEFSRNAYKLSQNYYYKNIYKPMFTLE